MAYVSPAVDQATRTFPVEVLVDNADRTLKPGFFAKGTVLTRVDENVLAAPDDAISTMAGVSTVYVIEDGKARQQQVTLGARKGTVVEIVRRLERRRDCSRPATSISSRPARTVGRARAVTSPRDAAMARTAVVAARAVAVKEPANEAGRNQRQAARLRHHDDGGAHRPGRVLLQGSRPRPDAEDRRAGRERAGPAARAPAPRKSRPRSPSASRKPSTPSAASTNCAPPPIRARRASTSPSRSSATSKSATQDVRDKVATIVGQFPARRQAAVRSRRSIPTRRRS